MPKPKTPEVSTCIWSPEDSPVYRYVLRHSLLDESITPSYVPRRAVTFVCLNPSTADEGSLDPTLRRVRAFTKLWGFDLFYVVNLFAFRSTNPAVMRAAQDPIGPDNDRYIVDCASKSELVVAGWGVHGSHLGRAAQVVKLLDEYDVKCLGVTKHGAPFHPLYRPNNSVLVEYPLVVAPTTVSP